MKKYFEIYENVFNAHYLCDTNPKKENFALHIHDRCELYVFFEGKGSFKVEGTSYDLKSGDILIMAPGESHYIDIDTTKPYMRMAIHFDPHIFSLFDNENELLMPFYNRKRGSFNIYRQSDFKSDDYKRYINNIIVDDGNGKIRIVSNLLPLLYEIKTAFEEKNIGVFEESPVRKIIEYINSNLSNDISLDNICKLFYISKPHLCRVFKAAIGVSVWEYITSKRLALSQKLMSAGHLPSKACEECGFKDYSVFYKAYKKHFGMSPKCFEKCKLTSE